MHLVGFIIRICHIARSPERQNLLMGLLFFFLTEEKKKDTTVICFLNFKRRSMRARYDTAKTKIITSLFSPAFRKDTNLCIC